MKEHKIPVPILTESLVFPPASRATSEGLVAVGGDLGTDRLMLAYRSGIFPWFNDDFGDDFVFEDVVEALKIYKAMYGDWGNITEFVVEGRHSKSPGSNDKWGVQALDFR